MRVARTKPGTYRLYALNAVKPGLVRDEDLHDYTIEVEIWRFPTLEAFGSFVAQVPEPLCIGTVLLEDGSQVKSFLCESYTVRDKVEITQFGGWRAYLQSLSISKPQQQQQQQQQQSKKRIAIRPSEQSRR